MPANNQRKIKSAMAAEGLTQAKLAKKFGVSQTAISKWVKDVDKMSFGDVKRLCKLIKIDINDLKETG